MDYKIQKKVALITGSTQGIGFATARKLCAEGVSVVINGRNQANVDKAVEKLQKEFPLTSVQGVVADLKDAKGCNKLLREVAHIDILINNMGVFVPKDFADISDDEWLDMFNINVMSGVRLSRHYLSKMLEQDWGRIIFISSESAIQIPKEMIHYGMSKTAQISIARGIAELTKGTSVTCNSILAGPTKSEGVEDFINSLGAKDNKTFEEVEQDFFKSVRPTSLLQRFADVDECANLICFVASSLSSATNGAALRVDGGVVQSAF